MTQLTTIAETISHRYGDDGARWHDADGIYLEDALRAIGGREVYSPEHSASRWTLPDGSVITTAGGGWDYGYPDCWCWQGAGHPDECREADEV